MNNDTITIKPTKFVGFDIETAPLPKSVLSPQIPPFDPSVVKTGNLKDPALIAAKIADAEKNHEKDFFEKAALSPLTGQVAAIGSITWKTRREDTINPIKISTHLSDGLDEPDAERKLISSFWETFNEGFEGGERTLFVGFNIIDFDLPFLLIRSQILEIPVPPTLFRFENNRFSFSSRFFDLRLIYLAGRKPTTTVSNLDAISRGFGIGAKNGSGADFAGLLQSGKCADAIEYLQNDVVLIYHLARKMGIGKE
jgi:DNA polymerase elongation subunit (family B)